jgi:DNA-binding transcriptional LysR family regulator
MDTHRLNYFLRIADEGSISQAASVLGIAQPALSRQVRLLEEDLGVTLFRRTSRGVALTEEGEQLRTATAAPLRQLELAMQWVGSPWGRVKHDVVLGMPAATAGVLAAPLLGTLTATLPTVNVRVAVADSGQLVERMLKGEIAFAVLHGPLPDERLFYRNMVAECPVLVGGPASRLAPDQAVRFSDLAELPLVLPSLQTSLRQTMNITALRQQVTINSRYETDSLLVSKKLIQEGLAYGILPLSACGAEVDAGLLRYAPLTDPVMTQHLGVAIQPQLGLNRGFVAKFAATIRDEAALLIESGVWPAELLAKREWKDELHADHETPPPTEGGMPQRSFSAAD